MAKKASKKKGPAEPFQDPIEAKRRRRQEQRNNRPWTIIELSLTPTPGYDYPRFDWEELKKKHGVRGPDSASSSDESESKKRARQLDEEYVKSFQAASGRTKRKWKWDGRDLKMGRHKEAYDSDDGFIDDGSEEEDEWIPSWIDTKDGGHYVNEKGKLEMRRLSDDESYDGHGASGGKERVYDYDSSSYDESDEDGSSGRSSELSSRASIEFVKEVPRPEIKPTPTQAPRSRPKPIPRTASIPPPALAFTLGNAIRQARAQSSLLSDPSKIAKVKSLVPPKMARNKGQRGPTRKNTPANRDQNFTQPTKRSKRAEAEGDDAASVVFVGLVPPKQAGEAKPRDGKKVSKVKKAGKGL